LVAMMLRAMLRSANWRSAESLMEVEALGTIGDGTSFAPARATDGTCSWQVEGSF
jgi:hypothetical protein